MEPLHSFLLTAVTLKLKFSHLSKELSCLRAREEKSIEYIQSVIAFKEKISCLEN